MDCDADFTKHLNEVNSIQFTQSADEDKVIATIQIVEKNGKIKSLSGVKILKSELSEAIKTLSN